MTTPTDAPPPDASASSRLRVNPESRSGCIVMTAIVGIVVLLTVWPMFSAWSVVRHFENTAMNAGYVLTESNGLALVSDEPASRPTYYRAVDSVQLLGGADADIAISTADAVLDGTFTGNVAFLGKELTILPGAVVMGDLEIAVAKYVTIRGEVVGEIYGEYKRVFRPQPTRPSNPPAEITPDSKETAAPAGT